MNRIFSLYKIYFTEKILQAIRLFPFLCRAFEYKNLLCYAGSSLCSGIVHLYFNDSTQGIGEGERNQKLDGDERVVSAKQRFAKYFVPESYYLPPWLPVATILIATAAITISLIALLWK